MKLKVARHQAKEARQRPQEAGAAEAEAEEEAEGIRKAEEEMVQRIGAALQVSKETQMA